MADVTARTGERPNRAAGRRPRLRLVVGASADEDIQPEVISAPARVALSRSAELLGIAPIDWVGALGLFATIAVAASILGWRVVPPAPWPESEAVFRVVFEEPPAPPAPAPVVLPDTASLIPTTPEPPAVAEPQLDLAAPELPPDLTETLSPPPTRPRPVTAKPATHPSPVPLAVTAAPQAPQAAPLQEAALPIVPPHPITSVAGNRKPVYPVDAERRHLEGKVTLRVEVSATGEPVSLSVAHSSGHDLLDQAALAAVRYWRFNPATRGGQPIAGIAEVPVQFRLAD